MEANMVLKEKEMCDPINVDKDTLQKYPDITHINQINKDQTQRTNIKSSKGKTTNNTQGNSHKDNS